MERDVSGRYNSAGRMGGSARKPKEIKHVLTFPDRGVKFDVFSFEPLTQEQVAAIVKAWMGQREVKDLTPWRTYKIHYEPEEA